MRNFGKTFVKNVFRKWFWSGKIFFKFWKNIFFSKKIFFAFVLHFPLFIWKIEKNQFIFSENIFQNFYNSGIYHPIFMIFSVFYWFFSPENGCAKRSISKTWYLFSWGASNRKIMFIINMNNDFDIYAARAWIMFLRRYVFLSFTDWQAMS